jgi:hypothetical protein
MATLSMKGTDVFGALVSCFCEPYRRHLFVVACASARHRSHLDVCGGASDVSFPSSLLFPRPALPEQAIVSA